MKKYIATLLKSPLFAGISEADLRKMMTCMGATVRDYEKDEIIFLMDEEICYIGIVLKGTVHMIKENSQGDKTLLSIIREGEIMGESFACGNHVLAYTSFIATGKVTLLFLPFQKIMRACKMPCVYHHKMMENMLTMIADKNVRLMQKIYVSSQKSIREKILAFLRLKQSEQQTEWVEIGFNRTILAEYLGVNRSALARELSTMCAEGILEVQKNKFLLKES